MGWLKQTGDRLIILLKSRQPGSFYPQSYTHRKCLELSQNSQSIINLSPSSPNSRIPGNYWKLTMRADADKCQAAGIGNLRLDGNGVSPSKDNKEWSF